MEVDLSALKVAQTVLIKRSNGRVHEAAISGIDSDTQYVSVEWTENGETKGKEVDLQSIISLNKDLFFKPKAGPVTRSSSRKTAFSNSKQVQSAGQLRAVENVASNNSPKLQHLPKVAAIPPLAKQNVPPPPSLAAAHKQPEKPEKPESSAEEKPLPSRVQAISKEKPPAVSKGRKSNCVKEVERLKKNREERRARAAEQLAQRNEDYDTSHPQWEFLSKIRDHRAKLDLRPLSGDEPVTCKKICVCVRKRPMNKKERGRQEIDVITVPDKASITVHEPKVKVDLTKVLENQTFCFDYSFDVNSNNELVYRYTAQPLVRTIFDKGMATCFAYGQTGSGKTHTMGGTFSTGKEQDATKGIYAFVAADVFKLNSQSGNREKDLLVSASFFEIYSGNVFDLLNRKRRLRILEDGRQQVQVVGLMEEEVTCVADVLELIGVGNSCRTSGTTSANQHSSRSHAVFQIILRRRSTQKLHGKFSLIDLAGNERGADTASSDRQTRMEGAEINKSLLALKECIRALGRKGAHLPFRGSKLTQVLKDSFVGDNSRTCMIAMISPGFNSCEHTLNTLRYADRVKELRSNKGGGGGGGGDEMSPPELPPSSPVNADLHYLHHSLQQEGGCELDKSAELLTFHEAVGNLVESEEQLVGEFRAVVQGDRSHLQMEEQLLEYVYDVDHDIDYFVDEVEKIENMMFERHSKFRERIQDLKRRMQEEERASRKVGKLPPVC